ncbi:MAG: heavy-metal-associated domain-containing protein, partial [Thermoplasmata archaeon]
MRKRMDKRGEILHIFKPKAEIILEVTGMNCTHCSIAVEKALKSVNGVKKVDVDLKKRLAVIIAEPESVDISKYISKVKEAGFDAKEVSIKSK